MEICPSGKYGRVGRRGGVGVGTYIFAGGASRRGLRTPASPRQRRRRSAPPVPSAAGRVVRAGGGQGGAPPGLVRLTPTDAGTPRCSIARAVPSHQLRRMTAFPIQIPSISTKTYRLSTETG